MKTLKLLILLLCFLTFVTKPSEDLEQAIIKTDLAGVKTLLTRVKLDAATKNRLLDLADNIILMRLRTVEIYTIKKIKQEDVDFLRESLTRETINVLKSTYENANHLSRKSLASFCCSGILFLAVSAIMDRNYYTKDSKYIYVGIGALAASLVAFINSILLCNEVEKIRRDQGTLIRNNLQKNYSDAILVKQLLLQASVVEAMAYQRFVN